MVFVDKHRVRMGLVLTHKSVSLSLSLSSCFCSACQCLLWIKVKTSTEVIHVLSLLLLCSAKSPGVLALLPFQTLFSVYSSLSRSLFPVLLTNWAIAFWEMSHHPAARCSLSTRALTHTSEYLQSSVTPFLSFSSLFPRSASIADFVFFFCLILMFSDSED